MLARINITEVLMNLKPFRYYKCNITWSLHSEIAAKTIFTKETYRKTRFFITSPNCQHSTIQPPLLVPGRNWFLKILASIRKNVYRFHKIKQFIIHLIKTQRIYVFSTTEVIDFSSWFIHQEIHSLKAFFWKIVSNWFKSYQQSLGTLTRFIS